MEKSTKNEFLLLLILIKEKRSLLLKTIIICMLLGFIIAILSPNRYTSSTVILPQSENSPRLSGNLGGLAALAGINLNSLSMGSDIPPTLFPKILESLPFQKEIFETKMYFSKVDKEITFMEYYDEVYKNSVGEILQQYTIKLPGLILKNLRSKDENTSEEISGIQGINAFEYDLTKRIEKQIRIEVNDIEGYVTISVTMPEAKAAAQLANKVQSLLQSSITSFKIQKAEEQLNFIIERYNDINVKYKKAQLNLANYKDNNKNMGSATAQIELEHLQSEYNLLYEIFSELSKQLEAQKIQVEEDTPVFTIIKPVSIPYKKSKPNRAVILIVWILLGVLTGMIIITLQNYWSLYKNKWFELNNNR